MDFAVFHRHLQYYQKKQLHGHAGMLRKIAYAQVWHTARQNAANPTFVIGCAVCGRPHDDMKHRVYECNYIDGAIDHHHAVPDDWRNEATSEGTHSDAIFWCRGLPPVKWYRNLIPDAAAEVDETTLGEHDIAGGEIYSDGSGGRDTKDVRLRRCGYGYALILDSGGSHELVAGAYGPLPGEVQTVPRAELMAVVSLLRRCRRAFRNIRVHVDCKYVVRGWTGGKDNKPRSNRDLWDDLWAIVAQVFVRVQLVKVRPHVTDRHVAEVIATAMDTYGNEMADHLAALGARAHEVPTATVRQVKYLDSKVRRIQERLVAVNL